MRDAFSRWIQDHGALDLQHHELQEHPGSETSLTAYLGERASSDFSSNLTSNIEDTAHVAEMKKYREIDHPAYLKELTGIQYLKSNKIFEVRVLPSQTTSEAIVVLGQHVAKHLSLEQSCDSGPSR